MSKGFGSRKAPASKKARQVWLTTVAYEVAFFVIVGLVWLYYFSDSLDVWWLGAPILPFHFLMAHQRKKWCRCPHCQESLLGVDGDSVFAKSCEHCGKDLHS